MNIVKTGYCERYFGKHVSKMLRNVDNYKSEQNPLKTLEKSTIMVNLQVFKVQFCGKMKVMSGIF